MKESFFRNLFKKKESCCGGDCECKSVPEEKEIPPDTIPEEVEPDKNDVPEDPPKVEDIRD